MVAERKTVSLGHIAHVRIFTVYPVCLYTFGNFLSLLLHCYHIAVKTLILVDSYEIRVMTLKLLQDSAEIITELKILFH